MVSIVSYPERGEGGNNRYRGNCSPKLIEDLLHFFKPGEVTDYMAGSGTTADAAAKCGIASKCYDLHSGFDLLNMDVPHRSPFTFWHPPYSTMVVYSDNMYKADDVIQKYGFDPRPVDLSRIDDWDKFVQAMNRCMIKQFNALDKGGRMAVLVGDIKRNRRLYSMLFELAKPGTIENVVIKGQHNCFSDATSYSGNFIKIVHEYVLIVRKDNGLVFEIQLNRRYPTDIREMKGATWRDIVAAVLEQKGRPVELGELYEAVAENPRAKEYPTLKEKIRQTLQYHPSVFKNTAKGVWGLAA